MLPEGGSEECPGMIIVEDLKGYFCAVMRSLDAVRQRGALTIGGSHGRRRAYR